MSMIQDARNLIKNKKVKQESDKVFYVDEDRVEFKVLPGRIELICSCGHHARFCKSSVICKHKLAAIFFTMFRGIR